MPLTLQKIRSLCWVKPVTTEVLQSQALIYLKPNAKLDVKDSIANMAAKLEQVGNDQKKCVETFRKQLSNAENWIAKVKQSKPDAIVHARVVKSKDETGKSERSTIVLYTKSRASNWASELLDHFFYSKDRALAAIVLLAIESRLRQPGNAIQTVAAPVPSVKQGADTLSGISANDFAVRLTNYRKTAAAAEALAAVESDPFEPFSYIRGSIQFAFFTDASAKQSSGAQRTKAPLDNAKARLNKDFMPPAGSSAFEKFVESIKSGTPPQNIDKALILDYCDQWKRYSNENPEFRSFVNSTPSLKNWNIIALVIADRNRYFSAEFNERTGAHGLSSTEEFYNLVERIKLQNAPNTKSNDAAQKSKPDQNVETEVRDTKEPEEKHIDEKRTGLDEALHDLKNGVSGLVENIEATVEYIGTAVTYLDKEKDAAVKKAKLAIDDALNVPKLVGTNLEATLDHLSTQKTVAQEKAEAALNDLSKQGAAVQEKVESAVKELNEKGEVALLEAKKAVETFTDEGVAAAKTLTNRFGTAMQSFFQTSQPNPSEDDGKSDVTSGVISAADGDHAYPPAELSELGSDKKDVQNSPRKLRKKRKIRTPEISNPVSGSAIK
ncbi:hypothetical protein [Noviherbaspirillum pedocola]|uniref:Uncharacterized protein n=1 Tax=Noviherbaspirillum pedocola TaxID=2801341 RepID=A0A934SX72_9BURK|nr:hypothetical protein [Noviherbaspirillum pedocola]MBK4734354.1 hypothetical protein [Noviherbaspirillum pedocola]